MSYVCMYEYSSSHNSFARTSRWPFGAGMTVRGESTVKWLDGLLRLLTYGLGHRPCILYNLDNDIDNTATFCTLRWSLCRP